MPTAVPIRPRHAATVKRLPWPDTVRFLLLLARVRWLNRRLEAAHRRVDRYGLDVAGPELVLIVRRWLAAHEAIGSLLGGPEPAHVAQVRMTIQRNCEPVPDQASTPALDS